jgi:hypothetical protein
MESIPEIDSLNSQDSFSDDDSEYLERKLDKDKNKKQQLMAQRLRGRLAKTQRLRKESDTNYNDNTILSGNINDSDDITDYWNEIKEKKPDEVRNFSANLFIKNTGKGGRIRRTRKLRKTRKTRKTRKVTRVKKSRKSKRTRK